MKTSNNQIETIRTDATIVNKSDAYINACETFFNEVKEFAQDENFMIRKSIQELFNNLEGAKNADCEYSVYAKALACEVWYNKVAERL